eukprot:scaffold5860_cov223-Amphora_coffeaeformis.AAC.6
MTSLSGEQSQPPEEEDRRRRRRRPVTPRRGTSLLGEIAAHLEFPSRDLLARDAEALAAQFDTSPFRLWLLFRSVDADHDGCITKSELVRALSSTAQSASAPSNISPTSGLPKDEEKVNTLHDSDDREEDDSDESDYVLPLEDIQALDELFDLVVATEHYEQEGGEEKEEKRDNDTTKQDQQDNEDDKTVSHRNFSPPDTSFPSQSTGPSIGITFPQFCRIMRYLWLQQLLQSYDDPPSEAQNKQDTPPTAGSTVGALITSPSTKTDVEEDDNGYAFECVDYASGYYRSRRIAGNVRLKRTRDFFLAPRHGHARMRWIDVPSGTFVPGRLDNNKDHHLDSQRESFRITILRLAVKYRFHPTSIEDAMDLDLQEPKVNSFEHSLLDLGKFKCGTISWLRHAGHQHQKHSSNGESDTAGTTRDPQVPALPPPRPAERTSSNFTFHSYQRESTANADIPDFVIAEGEDDVNINEGRHYFVTIPMFELSRRSQTSLDLYNEASDLLPFMDVQPLIIEVNEATLGIFVASIPDSNLVVTCSTKWRPTRIRPFGFRDNRRANARQRKAIVTSRSQNNMAKRPDATASGAHFHDWGGDVGSSDSSGSLGGVDASKDVGDEMIESIFQHEKMPLERVKDLLKKRHSIQRHRSSSWLMHAIIDAVVDNLGSISKIYEAQLQRMATRLFELQHRLSRQEVKEMIVMRRDLEWLQHELRPFARVIRHLIDDRNIGTEVTHYLEDVEDHLLRTIDELTSFATECVSLKDEYNAYLDRRMNDILYILTLVTTLVVPAQFFTGYFGMNFENNDGSLGDPLLNMGGTGTGIFWAIVVGFTLLLAYMMHRYHFFEKELEV